MATVRIRRVRIRERPARTRLERAAMRRPQLSRLLADLLFRVPPIRTLLLRDTVDRAYAALAREDLEFLAAIYYHEDAVLHFGDDVGPDYEASYAGREAMFDTYRVWMREWGSLRRDPFGFIDRGETVVVLGRERVRGESSGLEVDRELGQVVRLRGAAVAEQWEYRSWEEALAH